MAVPAWVHACLQRNGHLGWIPPAQRTVQQNDAHAQSIAPRRAWTLPPVKLNPGECIILTDFLNTPEVIQDMTGTATGQAFTGFHQFTGSCVGVSAGNAAACLTGVQRHLSQTMAMLPWWGYDYGKTRYDEGDRGRGEGAVDSVMIARMQKGVLDSKTAGLPKYTVNDGWCLTSSQEMSWSDGGSSLVTGFDSQAAQSPVGSSVTANNFDDSWNLIGNGYPILTGCSNYVGSAQLTDVGNGMKIATGRYDGSGGHSTTRVGILMGYNGKRYILYWNQWPDSTYPKDSTSKPRCSCWIEESEEARVWQLGGDNGETAGLCHLQYPAPQPQVLSYVSIV